MKMSWSKRPAALLIAAVGMIGSMHSLAMGDEVVMRDGKVYNGEIVSETRRSVVIDTEVHGIKTRLTLDRRQVKSITEGETVSDPAATPDELSTESPSIPSIGKGEDTEEKVLKREGYNLLLEVPLKGTFGQDIYPLGIAHSLEWAKEHGVTDVVFRINSGGGEVWCSMDMVEIMNQYRGDFKMHMLIESAISASIWPTFNCDTITMVPGSDFGGAVGYTRNSTGSAEVDLKMNSIMSAKLETAADANGHSGYLVRAMILSEAAVYAYRQGGEWVFSDTTEGIPSNYEVIDGPDTVLTLTAKQAIKYGIVDAMEDGRTLEEFCKVQGIEKWDNAGDIGHTFVERDVEKCAELREDIGAVIRSFYTDLAWLDDAKYVTQAGSALQGMRKSLGKYKRLMDKAENYHMPSILDSFEDAIDVSYWSDEIESRLAYIRRFNKLGP